MFLDKMHEEALKIILNHYEENDENYIGGNYDWFPKYMESSIINTLKELKFYGMLADVDFYCGNSWTATLSPDGITYFEDKEKYLKQKAEEEKKSNGQNIININADRSNVVVGDVTNSTLSIDNSIHELEKMIDEKGGEDKEQLFEVLDEAKELIENIKASRQVPNNKGFVKRLTAHLDNHGWFYAQIVALLGKSLLGLL